jgi:hypothetical protein
MSWNKNTILNNEIDALIASMEELGVPYVVNTIKEVTDLGINAHSEKIPLRRLIYQNRNGETVYIQEYMARSHDCDFDDVIVTKRADTPPVGPHEFFVDCADQHPDEKQCNIPTCDAL